MGKSDGPRAIESALAPTQPIGQALSRRARVGLLLLGLGLAIIVFQSVVAGPDHRFHPWRDAELAATYGTFIEDGVPLAKPSGTGSPLTQLDVGSGLVPAAWDDDPGIYLAASFVGKALSTDDPYTALRYVQGMAAALPWILLPILVARLFGRPLVGWTLIALMPVVHLLSGAGGSLGTDYGRVGRYVTLPVYALYGTAGSVVFLGLVVILFIVTLRLRAPTYLTVSVLIGLLAALAHLMRAASGLPVLLAGVVVLATFRHAVRVRVGAVLISVAIAIATPALVLSLVNTARSNAIDLDVGSLPKAHGTWHPLYLGLGYFGYDEEDQGANNPFGIIWSDEFGWDRAREIDPDVVIASVEYDQIMRRLYLSAVRADPFAVARTYLAKLWDTTTQQGSTLLVVAGAALLATTMRRWHRPILAGAVVALPALLYGFIPPTLVFPMRYFFLENTAALALLLTVSFGWMAAVLLHPHRLEKGHKPLDGVAIGPFHKGRPVVEPRFSYVLPIHNHVHGIERTLQEIDARLEGGRDEIIAIENISTDDSWEELQRVASRWRDDQVALTIAKAAPALGTAYRVGSLLAKGRTVVLTADDLPFGFSDLEEFSKLPAPPAVVIGSKAHPASRVVRSRVRHGFTRAFYWMRRVFLNSRTGDTQGSFFVDRALAQAFAHTCPEPGYLWTTELVAACESVGEPPLEVPVELSVEHGGHASRVSMADGLHVVVGILRVGMRRHWYERGWWLRRPRDA